MKFAITVLLALITLSGASSSRAQRPLKMVTYDSLALDTTQIPEIVENASSVLGFANNSNVVLMNGSYYVLGQFFHGGQGPIEFQVGSTIEFYWTRGTNDSSRAWFILRHYIDNANGWINLDGTGDTAFVTQPMTTLPQKYTLTVKHSGYNTIEVYRDTTLGAKPVYLDAVVLVQHGTVDSVGSGSSAVEVPLAQAAGFSCYPNPFIASQGIAIHSMSGESATYIVMDLLGREVASVEAVEKARLTVPASGTYFIRKRVGNAWAGAPMRVVAE